MKTLFNRLRSRILPFLIAAIIILSGVMIAVKAQDGPLPDNGEIVPSEEIDPDSGEIVLPEEDTDPDIETAPASDGEIPRDGENSAEKDGESDLEGSDLPDDSDSADTLPAYNVTGFAPLEDEVKSQSVLVGTLLSDLTLPDSLDSAVSDGENVTQTVIGGVTWLSMPEYDPDSAGTYEFTSTLPEGFSLAGGVDLPVITVRARAAVAAAALISPFAEEDGVLTVNLPTTGSYTLTLENAINTALGSTPPDSIVTLKVTGGSSSYTIQEYNGIYNINSLLPKMETLDLSEYNGGFGDAAFKSCTITTVKLRAGAKTMTNMFSACTKLTRVGDVKNVVDLSGCTFLDNYTFSSCTSITAVKLPEGATIGTSPFNNCSNIKVIALPDTTSTISSNMFPSNLSPMLLADYDAIGDEPTPPTNLPSGSKFPYISATGLTLTAKDTLDLSVMPDASSAPTVNYQWKKDGIDIPDADGRTYIKAALTTADSGEYSCAVSLAGVTYTTNPVEVTVSAVPITSAEISVAAPVTGEEPAAATIDNGNGEFTVDVAWQQELSPTGKFKGSTVYTATVTLKAGENYTFADLTGATFNGQTITFASNTGAVAVFSHTFGATVPATLENIAVAAQPNLIYTYGENLDLSGLSVSLTYNDGTSENVAFSGFSEKGITTSMTDNTPLNVSDSGKPITVTCSGKTADTGSLTVNKANPVVTWPSGLTATYGDTLADVALTGNGTATTAGTFTWTNADTTPVGSAGSQTHSMTFTPTDTANYNTMTQNVTITVSKKTLTIASAAIPTKNYDGTTTINPDDVTVTFSGTVAGDTIAYNVSNAAYTTKTAGTGKSTSFTVTLTGDYAMNYNLTNPTYTGAAADITAKTITAINEADISYTGKTYDGTNKVENGLLITLTTNSGVIAGDAVTLAYESAAFGGVNAGSHTVTFSGLSLTGTDAENYKLTAESAEKSNITISKADPDVNWPEGLTATYGNTLASVTLPGNGDGTPGSFRWTAGDTGQVGSAGERQHSMTFTPSDTTNYNNAVQSVSLMVNKATLVPSIVLTGAQDKIYDGTTAISGSPVISLSGAVNGENPAVTCSITFADANAGENKDVNAAGIVLSDNWGDNYELSANSLSITSNLSITKKGINIDTVTPLNKTYDGNTDAAAGEVTFGGLVNGEALILDIDYSVSAGFTGDADAGGSKNYTYTITMHGTEKANNYNLTVNTKSGVDGEIIKAPGLTAAPPDFITVLENDTSTHTFDLSGIVLDKSDYGILQYELGAFSDAGSILVSAPTLNGSELTYKGAGKNSGTATQVITIKTTNYENVDVTVTFTASAKNNVSGSISFEDGSATYDGTQKPHETATYSGPGEGGLVYSYSGTPNGSAENSYGPTPAAPTDAGNYTVTAKYEDDANLGIKTVNFKIDKANPAYTAPTSLTATYGDTLADVALTGHAGFEWIDIGTPVGDVGSRTHTATFTPLDTNNYKTVDDIPVTIMVSAKAVTFAIDDIGGQTYTGSALTPAVTVKDGTTVLTLNADYTVAYTDNINAGTANVSVTGTGNYAGSSGSAAFTINKANYGTKTANATVRAGQITTDATLTLPALVPGASYPVSGTVGGNNPALISAHSISGSTLKFSAASQPPGEQATITIPVSGATNYYDYDVVVTVTSRSATDAEKVAEDLDALTFDDIKGQNTAENNIMGDLSLIGAGREHGSAITWSSGNTSFIGTDGKVTRPASGSGDKIVTLTATVTNGSASGVKTFTLTVKEIPANTGGVSGTVTGSNNAPLPGLTVKVMTGGTGGTLIATTTTDANGVYSFSALPYGVYSLVAEGADSTVTKLVTIDKYKGTLDIEMPSGNQNTAVEVNGGNTPSVAVENLEEMFTQDDINAAQTGKVEIKLVVKAVDNPPDADVVVQSLGDKTLGLYLDAKLIKTVSGNTGSGTADGTYNIQPPTNLKIVIDLPAELWGLAPYSIIRVHNGVAKTIPATYDATLHTLTFEADLFSTYAIAYTPKNLPTNTSTTSSRSSSGSGNRSYSTPDPIKWIEPAEAKKIAQTARDNGLDYVRSRSSSVAGIQKGSMLALAGLRYQHDTVEGSVVQVRMYIGDPSSASKDILVSGYVNGIEVEKTRNIFEKWFTGKVQIIHMDQKGDFGMKVQIAAKVDLNGIDANDFYFYSYDRQSGKYTRIQTEYRIDPNGYLHFATVRGGDIIVSGGPLVKKGGTQPETSAPAGSKDLQNPETGGDFPRYTHTAADDSLLQEQEHRNPHEVSGEPLPNTNAADVPLNLDSWEDSTTNGVLDINLDLSGNYSKINDPFSLMFVGITMILLAIAIMLWDASSRKGYRC